MLIHTFQFTVNRRNTSIFSICFPKLDLHQIKFNHCVKSVQIRSFFWSVFSCIRTKYGDLRSKSPYSVRIQENTDQKKLRIWTLFTKCIVFKVHSVWISLLLWITVKCFHIRCFGQLL